MTAADDALALVQAYCGWHIGPDKVETFRLDGRGGQTLVLPTLRLNSVLAVISDGDTIDDYDWSAGGVIRLRCGRWSCRLGGISVTVDHGYGQIPVEVEAVITRLASRATADTGALAQVGQVRYAVSSSGTALGGALSDDDRAALDRYRLPALP